MDENRRINRQFLKLAAVVAAIVFIAIVASVIVHLMTRPVYDDPDFFIRGD